MLPVVENPIHAATTGATETPSEVVRHPSQPTHHPDASDLKLRRATTGSVERPLAEAALVSVVGMVIATFGALAFGKAGLFFLRPIFGAMAYGLIDIALTADEYNPEPSSVPSNLDARLIKRGLCWLAIGIVDGFLVVAWYHTYEPKRSGTWQTDPLLTLGPFYFIRIYVIAVAMLQAHRDRRPNAYSWWVLLFCSYAIRDIGICSPYALISVIGTLLGLFILTLGLFILVVYLDREAVRSEVRNGYKLIAGLAVWGVQDFTLQIASGLIGSSVFIESFVLILFQMVCLQTFIPVTKRCFGADDRKLWLFAMPTAMLGLELAPCILFLGSDMRTLEFWGLLALQEGNSVLQNTGQYGELYFFIFKQIGRPVKESERNAIEEWRSTIAPCDNIAEIASPIVILVAMFLEWVFDAFFERAPYLADAGTLNAWKSDRDRFRGELPLMITVVLVVRICFCLLEIEIRNRTYHQQRGDTDTDKEGEQDSASDGRSSSERQHNNRRVSMQVLFARIVHARDAPLHMRYFAVSVFGLQPILFVCYTAMYGKLLL